MKSARLPLLVIIVSLIIVVMVLPPGEAKQQKGKAGTTKQIPAPTQEAQKSDQISRDLKPYVGKAVSFGVTRKLKDMAAPSIVASDNVEIKTNESRAFRSVVSDALVPSKSRAQAGDFALQQAPPERNIGATIVNFEGLSIFDGIALGQGFLPPDTAGDVGPNHYVQSVNSIYRVYSKAGVPQTPVLTLGSIWASIPGPCANTNNGYPTVLYDSYADRWFISQFCTTANPNNHQLIAVSQTSDPAGAYFVYDFMMPNNKFNDYPRFGIWPNGYYMTDIQFNQAGTAFLGAGAFAFDRAKMLAGDPTASYIYFDVFGLDPTIAGLLPSDADGLTPPPAGAPNIFAYFIASEFGDPSDGIRLFDFSANFVTPASSTFVEQAGSPVAVAAFDPREPPGRDHIEQPPPANNATAALDSISDRLMHRLQYRNFGAHQSLVTNHTVNVGTGTTQALHQAGVRYYELRSTGGPYTVNEQSTFAPDITNRWMGSAAMDHEGNLAVGYSVSSNTVFPGIRYAGRLAVDPPNGLFQGEAVLQAGGFVQMHTSSRWGDYSAMNVDPVDDCTFWYTNEYYATDAPAITAEWHTRIGSFKVNSACVAPAQGTLTINVTNCDSALPVPGVSITVDGNLFGTTDAAGSFSSKLAPGTYTVVVSGPGYVPITLNSVGIIDGGTNTQSVCIVGAPSIAPAGATLTAESCGPPETPDNALSPNETVTLDFGLKNSGTAATTTLVATLLPGGGVTSPSGPQNYGSIPPDNTTVVTQPFTFTVDNVVCGSLVLATFQLQDGATDLGTITFSLQVGGIGPSATSAYSSGNIAVPIPDTSSVEIPINIPDSGIVQDVNVRFRLNHTFDGDLDIHLVHPDGTEVLLVNNRGGAGANFGTGTNNCGGTKTVLDDEAASTIASGIAPFAGSFRPDNPLSAFDGKATSGVWKLRVSDTAALDTGTIGCVELEITRAQFICCGDTGTPVIVADGGTVTAEACTPSNGAADPAETVTVSLCVRNNGTDSTTNLVGTLQTGGGVTSPSGPQNYGSVPPVGSVCRDFTFTVDPGTACGGTITASVQYQDGLVDMGTVVYSFTAGTFFIANTTASDTAPILIPAVGTSGPAAPYPSTINIAGVTGNVTKVTARLENINHTFPDDMDVLLVGPGGQRVLLMSDAGGSGDSVNLTYTFDDSASATLMDSSPNPTGTYKPSNFGTGDTFPAPAPVGPYPDPQLLSVFNGVNPNGAWSLYVFDDVGGDTGNINLGWSLTITTAFPVCCGGPPGPPSADLGITKTDSPDPVIADRNITYTLNFINNGPNAAINATVSDSTPSGTTFVSATAPAGWTSATPAVGGTGTITFSKPSVASGETATFQIVVKVDAGSPDNKVVTNTATVASSTIDGNPTNDTGTTTTTVLSQSDLTITKTHAGNFDPGQAETYTVTVTNSGDKPTVGPVTVTDTLPVGLTPTGPIGAHNGWSCSIVSQTVTCTRADPLAGGASYPIITITVNVANPAPTSVINTATVSGGGELDTSNNSASDPTTINCAQDFALNNASPLVISRFRSNGPGGPEDEFVEIFNPSNSAHTVASGTCTGGYGVFASAGNGTTANNVSLVGHIPNGTVIPARGYYLLTGASYSLGDLGRNGGSSTAEGDATFGCGGAIPACTTDIPTDAGLALINIGTNIVINTAAGFGAASIPDAALIVYDKVGFAPYGAGAPASAYPSLAGNFCEGTCLQPVGDASNLPTCTNPSGLFPVIAAAPACYGQSGQYELLRRQTVFVSSTGTLHQDTNSNTADILMVSPNPGINVGLNVSGVAGVKPILGAASPHDSTAPADFPTTVLSRTPFDVGSQTGPRNAERLYSLDTNVADAANNPLGTYALRFKYTNNSASGITGLRFSIDDLSTLCGPQNAAPETGTGEGRNLSSTPDCQAGGTFTAILKALNSSAEVLVDSTLTAQSVKGTVIEDTTVAGAPIPAPGPHSPLGGGIDSSLVINPSTASASLGDGVNGGTGVYATAIGSGTSLRVKVKFGVVRTGRFVILVVPMGKTTP